MALKDVWGFDPEEAARAQALSRGAPDAEGSSYDQIEERAAGIPADAASQVYELRRLFRL